jgi:hypothetical protein
MKIAHNSKGPFTNCVKIEKFRIMKKNEKYILAAPGFEPGLFLVIILNVQNRNIYERPSQLLAI